MPPKKGNKRHNFEIGETSPYTQWNNISQLGYRAAHMAYGYDLSLKNASNKPLYWDTLRDSGGVKKTSFLDEIKLYRSNPLNRSDFFANGKEGREFGYVSELSSDQLAVFADKNRTQSPTLLLGFRGTDTIDPFRFLGYMPHDYSIQLEKQASSISKSQYDALPQYPPDFCGCEKDCKTVSDAEKRKYKLDFVAKTTESYGGLIPNLVLPLASGTSSWLPSANMTERDKRETFEGTDLKNRDRTTGELQGGERKEGANCSVDKTLFSSNVCIGAEWSDFVSDLRISMGLIKGGQMKDVKHLHAAIEAEKAYKAFKSFTIEQISAKNIKRGDQVAPKIIISGHSLGGSLAFYAFCHLKTFLANVKDSNRDGWFKAPEVYFTGFNAAQLKTFDALAASLTESNWRNNAVHHRNLNDIVSRGVRTVSGADGNQIPTVSYSIKKPAEWIGSTDSLTHGLETFKMCEGTIAEFDDFSGKTRQVLSEHTCEFRGSLHPVCEKIEEEENLHRMI